MEIGRKIKSLRLKKGLTQEELGERTDFNERTYFTIGTRSQLPFNRNTFRHIRSSRDDT